MFYKPQLIKNKTYINSKFDKIDNQVYKKFNKILNYH